MTFIDFVFPKLWTPKTWLYKCLKSPAPANPLTSNMVNVRTVESCTTATLSYLLITAKAIEFEKVSLIGMQTLRTVSYHIGFQ